MTRRERWHANPEYREHFRAVIHLPFFIEAMAIITEEGLPRPLPALAALPTGADQIPLHALQNSKSIGFYESLQKLLSLADNPPPPKTGDLSTGEQWRHKVEELGITKPATPTIAS